MPEDKAIGLLNRAPRGEWKSGELNGGHAMANVHHLPFGGAADDSRGFVRRDLVTLENGAETHALRTHPKWTSHGCIKGWLPVADAPENPVFEADVGFHQGARATDGVRFRVYAHYDDGSGLSWDQVATTEKGYTGSLERVRADLGRYGSSLRKIELRVDAGDSSAQDWAVWADPVIYSDGTNSGTVSGFLPSTAGFHFVNSFDQQVIPDRTFTIPNPFGNNASVNVGVNVDYGLCGGMSFAAKDYYEAGISPWSDDLQDRDPADGPVSTDQPSEGSPLFRYLWNRLVDSFNLGNSPSAVARFAKLMHPAFRDNEGFFDGDANRADVIRQEWRRVRNAIDDGSLCPLGVVEQKTWNLGKIFYNHQVLAYGYEREGKDVAIYVYDPNSPLNDDVRLAFRLRDPDNTIRAHYRRAFLEQVDGSLDGFSVSENPADSVDGTTASGTIWEGNDGFRFSGYVCESDLEKPNQSTVYLDGEEAPHFGTGPRTVVIEGHSGSGVEYDFTVAGDTLEQVDGSLAGHSVSADSADAVDGQSASGTVWRGKDGYRFTGEITEARVESPEDVTVYVDGDQVDSFTGAGEGTGSRTLVIDGGASGGADYEFTVTGEVNASEPTVYAFFAIDYEYEDPPQNW